MRSKRQPPKEEKPQVPTYIVTYSDMVTLLLTFFVLLLTIAETRDPEMFRMGRDSFWQSIRMCGLGAMLGGEIALDRGEPETKYLSPDPNTSENRALDEYREKLRRAHERISQSAATLTSQLHAQRLDFSVVDVRFPSGRSDLDDNAVRSLSKFCIDLQQNLNADACRLYVLGLAGDETSEMRQWILSAARAQTVAAFVQEQLNRRAPGREAATGAGAAATAAGGDDPWQILWWGAGPGGNWAGQDRPDPGRSQILVAILKTAR